MAAAPQGPCHAAGMALLASTRVGAGPHAVILLHGFLGSSRNVGGLARRLADADTSLSVFALDLTGHGASPPLPPAADLGTLAGDVLSTAASLGLPRPLTLAGHSLGGRVGLRLALDDPAALGHLGLLDISPSAIPASVGDVPRILDALAHAPATAASREPCRRALLERGLPADVVGWLLLNVDHDGVAYRWRIDREALAALHVRVTGEDLWLAVENPRPHRIHCVRGGRSSYVSDADIRRLQAAGCRVDTVSDVGHWFHVERPAEVAALLLEGMR